MLRKLVLTNCYCFLYTCWASISSSSRYNFNYFISSCRKDPYLQPRSFVDPRLSGQVSPETGLCFHSCFLCNFIFYFFYKWQLLPAFSWIFRLRDVGRIFVDGGVSEQNGSILN